MVVVEKWTKRAFRREGRRGGGGVIRQSRRRRRRLVRIDSQVVHNL